VSARALLDVASRVVGLIEAPPQGGRPQVTPVIVEDLGLLTDTLAPALRDLGAVVLDVGKIAAEGSGGTLEDLGREATIAAALETTGAGGPRRPEFAKDGNGRRRAFWPEELESDSTEPAPHPLLGLAVASIDSRLASADRIVVLSYGEAGLESFEKELAWDYVCGVLPQNLPEAVEHLVVLVGAERPLEHHLTGEPSLRWCIQGDQVVKRNLTQTNAQLAGRLVASAEEHLVLFCAAGFSACMGMPLGNEMRDFALRKLLPMCSEVPDWELPGHFYALMEDQDGLLELEQGRDLAELAAGLTFERVLFEELRTFSPSPTLAELQRREGEALAAIPKGAVRHLRSMLAGSRRLIIITVNFDRLIESGEEEVEVFADEESFARCVNYLDGYLAGSAEAPRVPVLKLHGSFSEQTTLVATIEQTLRGLSVAKADALERVCRPTGTGRVPFVYVGSSMRDLDVTRQLSQRVYAERLDERWVMPLPAASVTDFIENHRRTVWGAAGMQDGLEERLISWTATEFLERLANGWR
jgi:hypothetical protein